jgi:hypothetical protein
MPTRELCHSVRFFCVGAQKAATTALHDVLAMHPDVYLPARKETKFFANDDIFGRGLSYYTEHYYSQYAGQRVVGEIDPEYLYFEASPSRIAEAFPDARIVVVLRDPIERAFSHYLMTRSRGLERYDFDEAIALEEQRLARGDWFNRLHYSYVERGFYFRQLQRYAALFPAERLKVLLFEDLVSEPQRVLKDLADYLEIAWTSGVPALPASNRARASRSPAFSWLVHYRNWARSESSARAIKALFPQGWPQTWIAGHLKALSYTRASKNERPTMRAVDALRERYASDVQDLCRWLGKDLSHWLHRRAAESSATRS